MDFEGKVFSMKVDSFVLPQELVQVQPKSA